MKTINPENRLKQQYQPCIWMQADVVDQKLCREDYNCPRCRYDRVMNNITEANRAITRSRPARTASSMTRSNSPALSPWEKGGGLSHGRKNSWPGPCPKGLASTT